MSMLIMSCYTGFFNVWRGWQSLNKGPRFYLRLIRRTGWLWISTSRTTDGRPFKPKKLSVPFLYPGIPAGFINIQDSLLSDNCIILSDILLTLREHLCSHPVFLLFFVCVWCVLVIVLVLLCCPIMCLYVRSCVLWSALRFLHKTMFGSSLPSVVCRTHVLFMLFVFFVCVEWCPTHIVLCCVFVFCVCFFFVIAPLVFSNVYFICHYWIKLLHSEI